MSIQYQRIEFDGELVAYRRIADGAQISPPSDGVPPARDTAILAEYLEAGGEVLPADPPPEAETPPAAILRSILADVEDFDDVTKAILDAMLVMMGG